MYGIQPNYANPWFIVIYQPMILPIVLNPLHNGYLNTLPNFIGNKHKVDDEHLPTFYDFTNTFLVEHEVVFLSIFVHYLEGDVRSWFINLAANSICDLVGAISCILTTMGKEENPLWTFVRISFFREGGRFKVWLHSMGSSSKPIIEPLRECKAFRICFHVDICCFPWFTFFTSPWREAFPRSRYRVWWCLITGGKHDDIYGIGLPIPPIYQRRWKFAKS